MMKEEAEDKKREIENWNKKVVVKNTHFYVNTREKVKTATHLDKFKGLREGEAKKYGYKNKKSNISAMVER